MQSESQTSKGSGINQNTKLSSNELHSLVFFAVEQQWPYPSKHALVGPQWVPVSELWDF